MGIANSSVLMLVYVPPLQWAEEEGKLILIWRTFVHR